MKIFGIFFALMLAQDSSAQFKVAKLEKGSIPKSIKYIGKIGEAVRWTDSTGDNIVILTTGIERSKNAPDDGYSDGYLYAYHFLVAGDSIRQTWKVYDYIKECPVDMFVNFVDKSFAVTDLDKDGRAEVWIMYKVSCQGDVSPVPMKIVMYEDNKKFALRGTSKVEPAPDEQAGGSFVFDDAFKNAPVEFRQYAEKLWAKHKVETWK